MRRKKIQLLLLLVLITYIVAGGVSGLLAYKDMKRLSRLNISANGEGIKQAVTTAEKIRKELILVQPLLIINRDWRQKLTLLEDIIDLKPVIYELAGVEDEKIFLLVMQNNTELRPSGGIWGSYGIMKVKDGQITSMKTDDTFNLDLANTGRFEPPLEMKDVFRDQWRFWNANWSPDFKKSVEQGLYFYKQIDPNVNFDGVIGPNLDYVLALLRISGPLNLKSHAFTVDENNFLQKMILEPMNPSSAQTLKDYVKNDEKNYLLADVGQDLINKLLTANRARDLAEATYAALGNDNLLLYFSEPSLQAKAEKYDWAGRMPAGENMVMAVDANLGSKLDFWVEKKMKVEGLGDGKYRATLSYKNTIASNETSHMFKIYRDYLRLYVPKDAKLISATGGQTPPTMQTDSKLGLNYIATTIVLPPAEEGGVIIEWQLNNPVAGSIAVLKQSGSHIVISSS